MADSSFFTVMIESVEPEHSFIQVFWAWGKHLGEAIEKVLRACARMGIENVIPSEADDYDFDSLPEHIIYDEKLGVYFDETRHYFPTEKSFIAPFGIIKSGLDGKL